MSHQYFPVDMKAMASNPVFLELSGPVQLGDAKVSYHFLNHPGITIGFRFEHDGKVVSYISDHEPYAKLNALGMASPPLVVDGDIGPLSIAAIKAFQISKRLPVTGTVDAATRKALGV